MKLWLTKMMMRGIFPESQCSWHDEHLSRGRVRQLWALRVSPVIARELNKHQKCPLNLHFMPPLSVSRPRGELNHRIRFKILIVMFELSFTYPIPSNHLQYHCSATSIWDGVFKEILFSFCLFKTEVVSSLIWLREVSLESAIFGFRHPCVQKFL